MKSYLATAVVGLLLAATSTGLPTFFIESEIAQHIFGAAEQVATGSGSGSGVCYDAPGIGFDFSATYATSSIKYQNGTVVDVGKIAGDIRYKKAMTSLAEPSPPLTKPFDRIEWECKAALQKSRKMVGLTSTPEIYILSSMINELKLATESKLGYPVRRAAASVPRQPSLLDGDIEEAFSRVGIKNLEIPTSETPDGGNLKSFDAAYAGMGYGICKDWRDERACRKEMAAMESKQVITISLDDDALHITSAKVHNAYRSSVKYHLEQGAAQSLGYYAHNTADYWDLVIGYIVEVASWTQIQEIILTGEYAEEKKFLDTVWRALNDLQDQGNLDGRAADIYSKIQVPGYSALYVGARGAAELAMRWQGEMKDCVGLRATFVEA